MRLSEEQWRALALLSYGPLDEGHRLDARIFRVTMRKLAEFRLATYHPRHRPYPAWTITERGLKRLRGET